MNYSEFVRNAVYSVQSQIGGQMVQLNSDLKSLNVFRVATAREKINDMIEQSIGNYLETMPKSQLKELAKHVGGYEVVPLEDLKNEENFDYASETVKRMVYSFILDKAEGVNENSSEPQM